MPAYLHAVFPTTPVTAEDCAQILAHGYTGVRCGFWAADEPRATEACEDQVLFTLHDAGLAALCIVQDVQHAEAIRQRWPGTWWTPELRNEPDGIGRTLVSEYRALASDLAVWAAEHDRPVYVGAVSNLTRDPLTYLKDATRHVIGLYQVRVSVHRYPPVTGCEPWQAHKGYASREAEVAALTAIIGQTRWAMTETGYHTARECSGWWWWRRCRQWHDPHVAVALQYEAQFWTDVGADSWTAYQLRDGEGDTRLDRYGRRYADGTWKAEGL